MILQKMVYVVGNEQELHFRQVFKTLELAGYGEYIRIVSMFLLVLL